LIIAGGSSPSTSVLLESRPLLGGHATAYVCRNYACDAPTTNAGELQEQLRRAARA